MTRTAVEILITAIVIVLAIAVISTSGNLSLKESSKLTAPKFHRIDVLGVNPQAPVSGREALVVYVMNLGSENISGSVALSKKNWIVVLKNSSGEFSLHPDLIEEVFGFPDNQFSKGEVWALICGGLAQRRGVSFSLEVFGPNDSQGMFVSSG